MTTTSGGFLQTPDSLGADGVAALTPIESLPVRQRKRPQRPVAVGQEQDSRHWTERLKVAVTYKPVETLRSAARNARTHSGKQIQQIAASIRQFDFVNPVLVDAKDRIVAGHARVAAAKELGIKEVPCVCLAHMTDAEVRAYRIADNRLAEVAGWDEELLALELGELADLELDFDIEVTGFDTVDLDQLLSVSLDEGEADDVAPEPEQHAISHIGDLWQLGQHRLLCADACERASYQALLAGQTAQLIFTDPPYNVPIKGHVSGLGRVQHREFAMASGEMSEADFAGFLTTLFEHLTATSDNGSIHFICMDWRHMYEMLLAGRAAYTELKNLCVWNKTNGGMGTFYRSKHELVFAFKNGTRPHVNNFGLGDTGRYRTNVWDYPGANSFHSGRNESLALHPTVKPVALVVDAIKDCSRRGGIVLDPFGGSGTTLIAAERCERRGYLLEIDPLYVDVTIRRWQSLTGQAATLAESGQTFDAVSADRQHHGSSVAAVHGEGPCHV